MTWFLVVDCPHDYPLARWSYLEAVEDPHFVNHRHIGTGNYNRIRIHHYLIYLV